MMGLQVELDQGETYLFAHDAAYLAVNYEPPSLPANFMYNQEEYYASHEKLRKLEKETAAWAALKEKYVQDSQIKRYDL